MIYKCVYILSCGQILSSFGNRMSRWSTFLFAKLTENEHYTSDHTTLENVENRHHDMFCNCMRCFLRYFYMEHLETGNNSCVKQISLHPIWSPFTFSPFSLSFYFFFKKKFRMRFCKVTPLVVVDCLVCSSRTCAFLFCVTCYYN